MVLLNNSLGKIQVSVPASDITKKNPRLDRTEWAFETFFAQSLMVHIENPSIELNKETCSRSQSHNEFLASRETILPSYATEESNRYCLNYELLWVWIFHVFCYSLTFNNWDNLIFIKHCNVQKIHDHILLSLILLWNNFKIKPQISSVFYASI